MINKALRAGVQRANNKHMVFANEEHEKFYYDKLEQARYQDCYHKALIYIPGISENTRNHFIQIYDIKSGYIKPEYLHQGWQTNMRFGKGVGWKSKCISAMRKKYSARKWQTHFQNCTKMKI